MSYKIPPTHGVFLTTSVMSMRARRSVHIIIFGAHVHCFLADGSIMFDLNGLSASSREGCGVAKKRLASGAPQ